MKKLLSIMLIMVMLVVGLTGCTTQEEEKKPIVVDSFETEVVESGYDDYYLVNVDGYITNTTIVVIGPITIKFEIYCIGVFLCQNLFTNEFYSKFRARR